MAALDSGNITSIMQTRTDSADIPLCVDLDGTLVRTDTLVASVRRLLVTKPHVLAVSPWWLLHGRACLKDRIAGHVRLDAARLPYQQAFVDFLRRERDRGRRLVLTTAAHHSIAEAIAAHVGLFDEVLASDGARNNKGASKRDDLVRRYGRGGFDYAGNSMADIDVWQAARRAIVVNPHRGVLRRARRLVDIERVFEDRPALWRR